MTKSQQNSRSGKQLPRLQRGCATILITTLASSALLSLPAYPDESMEGYLDLPLEDLLSIEVTSVSKKKQRLNEAAAAIFVITQDDIRRSGVTSIPEALRLAPGLQVAKIDANKWAITSRGFNSQFANKLLVLLDGRSVYTPNYSGVYWDVQDTLMEDIDRIEVIRGPGATLWGANAVNGVINIITKFASDTKGGLITLGAGNEEHGLAGFRYGADLTATTEGRFYIKHFARDNSILAMDGSDEDDKWKSLRAGFRLDGTPSAQNRWTLQGDIYDTTENQRITNRWQDPTLFDPASLDPLTPPYTYLPTLDSDLQDKIDNTGWNLLGRWNHLIDSQSDISLQIYFDHTYRDELFLTQRHDTWDLDFQHNLTLSEKQELIWGLGYRHIEDRFDNSFTISIHPDSRNLDLYSAFIQDQIVLSPDTFFLTIGSKFEHNDYTGYELQPSIRGLWKLNEKSTLWGSLSRAVRTPSRIERDVRIVTNTGVLTTGNPFTPVVPITSAIYGNDAFNSEKLLAYELGYRIQPRENLSFDLATFYNNYKDLQTYETIDQTAVIFDNKMSGYASGFELAVDWRPIPWWRIQASYTQINLSLEYANDSRDIFQTAAIGEGSSPEHQYSLRSSMDLTKDWEFDLWIYDVGELPAASVGATLSDITIDSYTSLNARLGWRPRKDLQVSLVGLNLQASAHSEFVSEYFSALTGVERSIYGKIRWEF